MADTTYPLRIPDSEVGYEKARTSRSNQYNLIPADHGQKLSHNLQRIANHCLPLQSSGSLDDQYPIVFQVILQDREDISVLKNFIEGQGLTIHAVKDGQHAIVSAPRDGFSRLQERVLRYRDKGIRKSFQRIQAFEPFTAEDKKAHSLLRYIRENPDAVSIDVQIMLLPGMAPDIQMRAQANITERIQKQNGALRGDPYHLTDGTAIIPARISLSTLNEIAEDPRIYRVEKTAYFIASSPEA